MYPPPNLHLPPDPPANIPAAVQTANLEGRVCQTLGLVRNVHLDDLNTANNFVDNGDAGESSSLYREVMWNAVQRIMSLRTTQYFP